MSYYDKPYPFELYDIGYRRVAGLHAYYRKPVDRQEVEKLVLDMSGIPAKQFPGRQFPGRMLFTDAVPDDLRYVISYDWPAQLYVNGSCIGTVAMGLKGVTRGSQIRSVEKKALRAWVRKLISNNLPFVKKYADDLNTLHSELTSESVRRLLSTT